MHLPRTPRHAIAGLASLIILCASGCNLSRPNWLNPGPSQYQRQQAQHFDPYPEFANGPDVTGGRPRDFQRPIDTPKRIQTEPDGTTTRWMRFPGTF